VSGQADTESGRKRAIARVVAEVAAYLGNTPAVARASYIDPRVIEHYENGRTIAAVLGDLGRDSDFGDLATRGRAESAVLKLLLLQRHLAHTAGLASGNPAPRERAVAGLTVLDVQSFPRTADVPPGGFTLGFPHERAAAPAGAW
jgi:hypothetical protein